MLASELVREVCRMEGASLRIRYVEVCTSPSFQHLKDDHHDGDLRTGMKGSNLVGSARTAGH